MILKRHTFLLAAGIVLLVSEIGIARKKAKYVKKKKPTIDELPLQHILLRSIMKNDGCRLYYPWSNVKNPSFELNNATCWHGCKIVADLYEDQYPEKPRLIRSGGCSKSIKLIFLECKCELTSDYASMLRWRSLKHCAHKYLAGIVDFTINDTRPTTTTTTELIDYSDDLLVPKRGRRNYERLLNTSSEESTDIATSVSKPSSAETDMTSTKTSVSMLTTVTERTKRVKKKRNKPWRRNG